MKKTILIIEDNKDIRESTAEIIELAGFNALTAIDGKNGVELAQKHLPDLILCDIMMPELDGYGVLYLLSKHAETALIPFIFLTAKAERLDMRKGMEMGADDYLTKPFDDVELLSAIEIRLQKVEKQKNAFAITLNSLEDLGKRHNGLSELDRLIRERKNRTFKKKQIIYYEGDPVQGLFLLLSGKIKTFKQSADGRELMTGFYESGSYLAIQTLLTNEMATDTAEVLEDAEVCVLPKNLILDLVDKHPEIGKEFIKILSTDLQDKENHLLQLAYHSVRKRMAEVLLRLAKSEGSITLSRENLASMAGMATETVSRTLSDFKDEALIEKRGSTIIILNQKGLEQMKN